MTPSEYVVRSFRDPAGSVVVSSGRVLRLIRDPGAAADVPDILALPAVRDAVRRGAFVGSQVVVNVRPSSLQRSDQAAQLIVEHEPIPFPSFPYEWPPEMLWAAGVNTIELAHALLPSPFGLKDATPYNVLFRGAQPVFVDLASIARRDARDPIWTPAAQFARTFHIPLLLAGSHRCTLQSLLLMHRDGVPPECAYRSLGPLTRLLPPALGLVTLPTWLGRASRRWESHLHQERRLSSVDQARFVLSRTVARQHRLLERLRPKEPRSGWTAYMDEGCTYGSDALARKEAFLRTVLSEHHPRWVLDIGCNTGHFSALAAQSGADVVAIDADVASVGRAWRRAHTQDLRILPLVVDIARPSPSIGWRNAEHPSFLDRAQARFDAVLMLALLHHLLVGERVPLDEIVTVAAGMCRRVLIVEYVGRDDPMFRRIARGRDALFEPFDRATFEAAWRRHFSLSRVEHLPGGTRSLYAWCREPIDA